LYKSVLISILLLCNSFAYANPDAIVIPNGDVRIKGAGSGLVFPDGSIQYKATVEGPAGPPGQVTLDVICQSIADAHRVLPQFCLTAKLLSISVTPENSSLTMGINSRFNAIGTFSDASKLNLTTSVIWSTSNIAVAAVEGIGGVMGNVTPVGEGTTMVTAMSGSISGTTSVSVLVAPSGLSATTISTNQINLAWADNSSNETGFKIERKTRADGTYIQIETTASNATSYRDVGLSEPTTYYYRVRTTNSAGDSVYSSEVFANTRFINKGNGTMLDSVSKLIWLKDANCFGQQVWDVAMTKSSALASGQCELSDSSVVGDWHLPTIYELRIIREAGYETNLLNTIGFSNVQERYWSSTLVNSSPPGAGIVLYQGNFILDSSVVGADDKRTPDSIWPVRSGQ
jgi:hypothetical protein